MQLALFFAFVFFAKQTDLVSINSSTAGTVVVLGRWFVLMMMIIIIIYFFFLFFLSNIENWFHPTAEIKLSFPRENKIN